MRVISYFIDMYIHNIDYVLCLQILTIDGAAIVTLVFGLVIHSWFPIEDSVIRNKKVIQSYDICKIQFYEF